MALDPTQVLKRPLITEKSTWEATHAIAKGKRQGQPVNRYSFEVAIDARKPQIKQAVEKVYGVRVQKVSTQVRKGRERRTRWGITNTGQWKKATVQLHPDDRIELF